MEVERSGGGSGSRSESGVRDGIIAEKGSEWIMINFVIRVKSSVVGSDC
jgi:hypothetical protein